MSRDNLFWDSFRSTPTPSPLTARFTPEEDITTFELATIVSKITQQPISFLYESWENLDASIKRHFKP